jgi:hypothetical protein
MWPLLEPNHQAIEKKHKECMEKMETQFKADLKEFQVYFDRLERIKGKIKYLGNLGDLI